VYGLDARQLMARIHGVIPDGSVVEGVEVFGRAYAAVGMGWLVAPTRWPGLRRLADLVYRIFARNRLRWTGRESACEDRCEITRSRAEGPPAFDRATSGSNR
jgi:predicted DCC family thiol-disulfide oxidoreductase YuxK